jgi:hypothetical protein
LGRLLGAAVVFRTASKAVIEGIWRFSIGTFTAIATIAFALFYAFAIMPFIFLYEFWQEIFEEED